MTRDRSDYHRWRLRLLVYAVLVLAANTFGSTASAPAAVPETIALLPLPFGICGATALFRKREWRTVPGTQVHSTVPAV